MNALLTRMNSVKNNNSLSSFSELLSRINYETVKQKKDGTKSILLQRLLKALRLVMQSRDYSLDATLVLKEIDKHPETARRTLDLLCPTSGYTKLKMLFNYDDLFEHIKNYVKEYSSENPENLCDAQGLLEKDFGILKNTLSEFLGKERELRFWGRQVNWDKNVRIPIPTNLIHKNTLDKDPEQKDHSLEESSLVILDDNNDILRVVLYVFDTGTGKDDRHYINRSLFTIKLEPKQKAARRVRIVFTPLESIANKYKKTGIFQGIPLHIEDRGKGLCVYSVTQISAVSSKISRWYLHAELNQNGNKKIKLIERQIDMIQSDPSMTNKEKTEKLEEYNQKNSVIYKRQYQTLTVKTKGLLLYSLLESNLDKFNEIMQNISGYNKYNEEDFDSHYESEALFPNTRNQDQIRKTDFPFLFDYHKFKDALPQGFAFNVLKRIAMALQNSLETISSSTLKYKVTSQFFAEVRDYLWNPKAFGISDIDYVNDATFMILNNYHSVIGSYVRRKQEMLSRIDELKWNEEIRNNKIREEKLNRQII